MGEIEYFLVWLYRLTGSERVFDAFVWLNGRRLQRKYGLR